jgi:hypothetical protein
VALQSCAKLALDFRFSSNARSTLLRAKVVKLLPVSFESRPTASEVSRLIVSRFFCDLPKSKVKEALSHAFEAIR